jgi:hypothetical protein
LNHLPASDQTKGAASSKSVKTGRAEAAVQIWPFWVKKAIFAPFLGAFPYPKNMFSVKTGRAIRQNRTSNPSKQDEQSVKTGRAKINLQSRPAHTLQGLAAGTHFQKLAPIGTSIGTLTVTLMGAVLSRAASLTLRHPAPTFDQ